MRAGSLLLASLVVCGDALRPFTAHHTRAPVRCRGVVLSTSAAPDDDDDERQSRSVFTALAAVGAAETGFLSWDKLGGGSGVETLCAATGGGCADVLSGPWASVAGVPLALFGLAAYSSMALLAAAPLLGLGAEATDDSPSGLSTGDALIAGSATMAAFSGCLILLLLLVIKEPRRSTLTLTLALTLTHPNSTPVDPHLNPSSYRQSVTLTFHPQQEPCAFCIRVRVRA